MRCAAYCTATAFNINGLLSYLRSNYSVNRYREVTHCQLVSNSNSENSDSDVFFFPYGAVVCWGLSEDREKQLLAELREFEVQPVDPIEDDVFSYEYGKQAKIEEDEIILPER